MIFGKELPFVEFDPEFDRDYTDEIPLPGERLVRGGHVYNRPYGWYRMALRVIGKYENDNWLGCKSSCRDSAPGGTRAHSVEGEWLVGYQNIVAQNSQWESWKILASRPGRMIGKLFPLPRPSLKARKIPVSTPTSV